ncbi:MAG: guanylate kinase [Gammaproteobacteria bacterium]|nr:guanylate kinase [Gammaproteobacteria bacterium]
MSSPGILILSAPSGAGKTSLAKALVDSRENAQLTVSHTTRKQRPGEVDGQHYFFVEKSEFETMIQSDDFIEHAVVFDHYYGTSVKSIDTLLSNGKHAILDIDWQGARNVRNKFPQAKSCFIMPPSLQSLEMRLRQRQQDSEAVILRRMRDAKNEMGHRSEYDQVIVNDNFEEALKELQTILKNLDHDD